MQAHAIQARALRTLCAAAIFLAGAASALAQSAVTLTAGATSTTLPDGQSVPMWGYTCGAVTGAGASCTALNGLAQSGTSWQPPLITVPAGQPLTVTLVNNLTFSGNNIPTSLVIVGQLGGGLGSAPVRMPSPTHAPQGTTWPGTVGGTGPDDPVFNPPKQVDRVRSFATEALVGTPATLTWNNLRPGTYLIHSGTQPSIQHPMGLYGVVVVTDPANAYPGQAFEKDVPLLMSEIDPVQNAAVAQAVGTTGFSDTAVWNGQSGQCGDPAVHTCYPPAVNYSPLYYLVNGVSFDRSNLAASSINVPATSASGRLLLRLVNAGLRAHTPSVVGASMSLHAEDGNLLPGQARVQSQLFMAAGKTFDVTIPGSTSPATFAVYDRMLALSTNNQRDGGMQAYIKVAGGAASGAGSASAAVSAAAVADTYNVVAGVPLTIGNPAKGVVANDRGIYGVAVVGPAPAGLNLNSDGTFTYSPPSGFAGTSFTYCGNGATSGAACATVTLNLCGAGCLGGAPTANADSYTSPLATSLQVARPGVLNNDSDPSGYALSAASAVNGNCGSVSLASDGSFSVTKGAGASCSFTYQAKNAQGTASSAATVTVSFGAASNLAVTVKDAKDASKTITDYRWIIEEDRTVFIDPKEETLPLCKDNPSLSPPACSLRAVRNVAINFHTSYTPVVAQGCTGPISCETGQAVLGAPAVCDAYGRCSAGTAKAATLPSAAVLDPTKRYFISILPGDAADPLLTEGAVGHAMGGASIAAGQTAVNVIVQPLPIQTATFHVFIFQDDNPLNGENDTGGGVDVLAPNEPGLGGFNIVLTDQAGAMGDAAGQLTYDMFGMPVSNALANRMDPATGNNACPISPTALNADTNKQIVGMIVTCPKYEARPDGTPTTILSPLAGHAVIANMYPGMYEVTAVASAERIGRGEQWLQTNTLDGTKAIEVFIKAGEPGYFQEFGPGGYHVAMGFANPKIIQARKGASGDGKGLVCSSIACTANFYGQVTNTRLSRTPDQRVYSSGDYTSNSYTTCYASLSYPDSADFDFAFCDPEGKFQFNNIPNGNFKVTIFDQNNDLLVDGLSTSIKAGSGGAGSAANNRMEMPVMQWRTNLYGRVFIDTNGDGVSQEDEPGLPLVPFNVRYRDGSYANFNNTDFQGYAGFNEVFPRLNWLIVDSDQARYKLTGVHVVYDAHGPVDGSSQGGVPCASGSTITRGCGDSVIAHGFANTKESPTAVLPGALRTPGSVYCADADCTTDNQLTAPNGGGTGGSTGRIDAGWASTQGWQGLLGSNAFVEFAMQPFKKKGDVKPGLTGVNSEYGENGGIRGHVLYASTRPFDDPALSVQLMWTPGIPNAKINLYQKTVDDNGVEHLKLVDTTTSTSFDGWAQGFRRNADGSLVGDATNGYVPNMNCPGQEASSPFYFTMVDGRFPLDEGKPLAERGRFKCYDGWSMASAVQPAPYNGMYKFPSVVAKAGASGTLPIGEPGASTDAPSANNWFLQLDPKRFKTNCSICTTNPDDGTPMLPPGTYVVEVVLPPGYEIVKEEDKNILQGDAYIAPAETQFAGFGNIFIMPDQAAVNAAYNPVNAIQPTSSNGVAPRREGDTGSVEVFWPCVGEKRVVPDFLSLYPQSGLQAPFAGAVRPLCDRKEVELSDEMTVLAKFYLFTSAHVASHFTGSITNDFASEFDPFSPQFGEKFAVPNVPVGVRDFSGREISRVYGDQWGIYNGMTSSTWTVFPPSPSGYIPNMMIMCMNDPGPIPDPANPGQMITDPAYNPAYSNFCYEMPYMPGQTSYLDTPVVPTMGFAAGYNLPDCEYPDTTPAIRSVQNSAGTGPWVDPSVAEVRASLSFSITGTSLQSNSATNPGDRVNSIAIGSTTLFNVARRCGASVSGSVSVDCTGLLQAVRDASMATAVRAAINAGTGTHGYTASGSANTVTVTAAAGTGATVNGLALNISQTGLNGVGAVQLAGGVSAHSATTTNVLTITALGDKPVLNHAYSGPNATKAPYNNKFITRHYGFGATAGTVSIGGVNATVNSWTDTQIQVQVPSTVPACALQQRNAPSAKCGQLVVTAANGKSSIDTVTVTVGGKAPIVVTPGGVTYPSGYTPVNTDAAFGRLEPSPLQSAIDNAQPGDLIIVQPGTYRDNLLMWKPLRLQGVGAESVTLNADAHPAGKMDAWRREVNCLFGLSLDGRPLLDDGTGTLGTGLPYDPTGAYTCPAHMQQRVDRIPFETIIGWDTTGNGNLAQMLQEPTLMGAYEGAGVTALGRGVWIPDNSSDFWGSASAGGFPLGYQHLTNAATYCNSASSTRTDGRDYGTSNYQCNPSRVDGLSVINSSQGGGAIWAHAWNHNLEVSNNRVRSNHGTLTGGITIGNGEFPDPYVCDATVVDGTAPLPFANQCNTSANQPFGFQYGYGFNVNTKVHHNMVVGNASIGDALYSGTPSAAGGVSFCSGSDGYLLEGNWVCGNMSYGDSGGVAHVGFSNDGTMRGNWVLFNQSQQATIPVNGGGIGVLGASPDRTIIQPDGTALECGSTTDADCPPGLPEGTGRNLLIERNLVLGNSADSGSGGGLRLQMVNGVDIPTLPTRQDLWNSVTLQNNIIANNVAGWDGGGVSIQDALKVRLINNTVINNDTTASAGVLFKTIGAPMASTPPPGCNPGTSPDATCPDNINNTSTNQAAGVVTMSHTPNMVAALGAAGQTQPTCPAGYGYQTSEGGSVNNACRYVSLPLLLNNVLWHNRAFHVEVGDLGTGEQNTQKVVTLVPSLNQAFTGMCATTGTANGAPGSGGAVNYWDIGVRGDTGPSSHVSTSLSGPGGYRMVPRNSMLTGGDYTGNGNLLGTDPQVIADYCNGSRLPPEGGGLFAGFNAPAGRAETTGLYPVFALNQTVAAPTVDEGNNWVNLTWGPLSLSNPSQYSAAGVALTPMGDYRIASGSGAINAGVASFSGNNAPANDFFGANRTGAPDIGAVEFVAVAGAPASVSPGTLDLGSISPGFATTVQNLTLHNNGTSTMNGIVITVTGAGFARSGGTCTASLAAGSACTIGVVYTSPSGDPLGPKSGQATVTATGVTVENSPAALVVNVIIPPNITRSPTGTLSFTGTVVGATSASQTVTLTNAAGTSQLDGLTVSFGSTRFTRTGGTCGTTLNAGASCTIDVAYSPLATATVTSSMTITGNAPVTGLPMTVPLSGTGTAPALPGLATLDNFNRANATTLGTSSSGTAWNQGVILGAAAIRVNANQASDVLTTGAANLNVTFGTAQAAAFKVVNATLNGDSLLLKVANAGGPVCSLLASNAAPCSYVRVQVTGSVVNVQTTADGGTTYTPATLANGAQLAGTVANGDVVTARVDASGLVYVWKTTGSTTSFLGAVPTTFTGSGRIGLQLPAGARVDDFAGGNAP